MLGSAVGVDLASLGESEVPTAGGRRIDIVARDDEGSEFVVENQYGRSDHDHRTRGLAYAVARRARGLIIVAEEHRDEFKAVAQYLNEGREGPAEAVDFAPQAARSTRWSTRENELFEPLKTSGAQVLADGVPGLLADLVERESHSAGVLAEEVVAALMALAFEARPGEQYCSRSVALEEREDVRHVGQELTPLLYGVLDRLSPGDDAERCTREHEQLLGLLELRAVARDDAVEAGLGGAKVDQPVRRLRFGECRIEAQQTHVLRGAVDARGIEGCGREVLIKEPAHAASRRSRTRERDDEPLQ